MGLVAVSVAIVALAGLYVLLTGRSLPLAAFAWPAMGFIVGLIVIFTGIVEIGLQIEDEIDQFPQLVEDDLEDLRRGIITPTHFMVAATLIAAAIELGLLLWYEKVYASWRPLNVLLVALLVVGLTLFWSLRSRWFQIRTSRLAPRIYWVPAAGWLVCILIGAQFAEPQEFGGRSQLERSQEINAAGNAGPTQRAGSYLFLRTADVASDAILSFDCDDEACLFVLLVAVVALSIFASATIPHFWVVATLLLLTLMGVITLRELLYTDRNT